MPAVVQIVKSQFVISQNNIIGAAHDPHPVALKIALKCRDGQHINFPYHLFLFVGVQTFVILLKTVRKSKLIHKNRASYFSSCFNKSSTLSKTGFVPYLTCSLISPISYTRLSTYFLG